MPAFKERIMAVAKQLYMGENSNVLELWGRILEETDDLNLIKNQSQSLAALCLLIESIRADKLTSLTKLVSIHKEKVLEQLQPFVDRDLKSTLPKEELINELLSNDTLESGTSLVYYRLREAISMQQFEVDNNVPTYKVVDGNQTHVAKILPNADEDMILNNGGVLQWEALMTQAITSMDDYTADTFDVISILWMNTAKTKDDVLHFSHEDVLRFRQLQKQKGGKGSEAYRKQHRIEAMKRLAAIASIWISVSEDEDIAFVEKLEQNKDFKISKFRRLFQIDNVTFAHDRKTNEAIGIYECDIKPTELLAKYLHGAKKTTGFLSLKALQYNPVKQKYHKRLTRYLSWQWKIRAKKNEYEKPFNIGGEKGLLKTIGLECNEQRPFRTKETFEGILDKLTEDSVIGGWHYVEIDEEKFNQNNWFEKYWSKLQIVITLPPELKKEFSLVRQEILDYKKVVEFGKNLHYNESSPDTVRFGLGSSERTHENTIILSPELVQSERRKRGLSLNKAAEEIGISHTTLSRYEKGLIKTPNSKNDERIKHWLMK